MIFDSSDTYYGRMYPYINLLKFSTTSAVLEEDSFIDILGGELDNVICASVLPKSRLEKGINVFKNTTYVIVAALIIVIFISYYIATITLSKRINLVIKGMKHIGSNMLNYRIPVKTENDEMGQIASHFNEMCDNLQEHINSEYVYKLKQRSIELSVLYAQINPHFLFNTLEAIASRIVNEENEEVEEMILALASLFRSLMKREMIVEIEDELEYSKMYLKIFSIRYTDYFNAEFDIENGIEHFGILKNLLQPILENYVIHGFVHDKKDNHIKIKGYRYNDDIILEISDNGTGIPIGQLDNIKKRLEVVDLGDNSNIGLSNVNERIKLVFGLRYGVAVDSVYRIGTKVTINIPVKTKDEIRI